MEFHGTKWYFIWRHQSSMEFHGIFHGIPCNTCVICNGALLIPWNPVEFDDFFYLATPESNIPCHTFIIWNGALLIPWNPIELGDFLFGDSRVPRNFMVYPIEVQDNMILIKMTISKFHGIPWNLVIFHLAAPEFHGIPWNSMELGNSPFGGPRVPWNSMEFHVTPRSMEFP